MAAVDEAQQHPIAQLSSVNMLAAGSSPSRWAELQARGDEELRVRLDRLAHEWRDIMLRVAEED